MASSNWRLARSLEKLRAQINTTCPNRNKASDGTIGDDAHKVQGTASDHNPNADGVVTALDITHDPANGVDIDKISDELVASRDPRIKYVIANGLIAGPYNGWTWQMSSGHYTHIHISVNVHNYDDDQDWNIGKGDTMELKTDGQIDAIILNSFDRHATAEEYKYYRGKNWHEMLDEIRKSDAFKARSRAAKGLMDSYGQVDAVILNSFDRHVTDAELKKYKGKNWHKTLDEIRTTEAFKDHHQAAKGISPDFEEVTEKLYKKKGK